MQDSIQNNGGGHGAWQTVDEIVVPSHAAEPLVPVGMKTVGAQQIPEQHPDTADPADNKYQQKGGFLHSVVKHVVTRADILHVRHKYLDITRSVLELKTNSTEYYRHGYKNP